MCEICAEQVLEVFPALAPDDAHSFLMSHTAYPMGDPWIIAMQLRTAKKAITQGRKVCMMCGKARAKKHMHVDFCKKPCLRKWRKVF